MLISAGYFAMDALHSLVNVKEEGWQVGLLLPADDVSGVRCRARGLQALQACVVVPAQLCVVDEQTSVHALSPRTREPAAACWMGCNQLSLQVAGGQANSSALIGWGHAGAATSPAHAACACQHPALAMHGAPTQVLPPPAASHLARKKKNKSTPPFSTCCTAGRPSSCSLGTSGSALPPSTFTALPSSCGRSARASCMQASSASVDGQARTGLLIPAHPCSL